MTPRTSRRRAIRRRTAAPVALLLLVAGCSPQAYAPAPPIAEIRKEERRQYEAAAARLLVHMEHVARVGSRITVAGAPLCGEDVKPYVGVVSTSRSSLARRFGSHVAWTDAGVGLRRVWDIGSAPEVLAVLPDSPAAAVGMQIRDRILEIEVADGTPPSRVRIEIQRGEQRLELELPYVSECAYSVSATIADQINAHVASDSILVSTGLLRFVEDDDELAFAIGHELAHRILGHRSSRMRSRERAADRMGTELAARAGYDPAAAVRLVRRLAAEHPEWIGDRASPGHPGTAHRVAALEAVVDELVRRTTPAGSTKIGDDQARSSTSAGQSSGGPA
jgi:hypothetical protein